VRFEGQVDQNDSGAPDVVVLAAPSDPLPALVRRIERLLSLSAPRHLRWLALPVSPEQRERHFAL